MFVHIAHLITLFLSFFIHYSGSCSPSATPVVHFPLPPLSLFFKAARQNSPFFI
ncbi:hypothetical protein BACCAP_00065 [Pseudoflavonifractor capillosus ATCC 29799]|uniref:Uncharacterized protein n=1 Tax=Pseudoflavonifractor capillosus ATCC 29799 TaxID=411467 RepID=A6NPF1_9FIRM|nr:hypothetical protein BACCAP_00065 [Pseudoflavonifractor capillosus ATCC 29799]